jgi:hypothetical protein
MAGLPSKAIARVDDKGWQAGGAATGTEDAVVGPGHNELKEALDGLLTAD